MGNDTKEAWQRACRRKSVLIIPGGCSTWKQVERVDQQDELKRWARDEPREKGWLHLHNGLPSYFMKSNGQKEPLRIAPELTVMGYNILTSTHDGNPNTLSVFEQELKASGKYRYWKHRRDNVVQALKNCHVIGLCESTSHMIKYILSNNPYIELAQHALKVGEYDGSAILVDKRRIRVLQNIHKPLMPQMTQIIAASLLEDVQTDTVFWFVVLHLKSDGSGVHGGKESVRVKQAERALKVIDKLEPTAPIVIVGDLNSDRFLYPAFDEQGITHVLDVFSSFKTALPLQPTYHHYGRAAFDHILLRGADVTSTHIPDAGGVCPNELQGSDHLPVRANIVIRM